jgi:hypothetical protein
VKILYVEDTFLPHPAADYSLFICAKPIAYLLRS